MSFLDILPDVDLDNILRVKKAQQVVVLLHARTY